MKFYPADEGRGFAVQSYGPGQLVINGEIFRASLVLTPQQLIRDWRPKNFEELISDDFSELAQLEPEVLILGTGDRQRFPDAELYRELMPHGIGLEVMDTAAACRTYNILMSEDRRVVAALLMIEEV